VGFLVLCGWSGLRDGQASPPGAPPPAPAPPALTLAGAVRYALENNPRLAALRQQHGIAAAALVIARTYPYNPVTQSTLFGITGPESAGITNVVGNQHKVIFEVEVRGQRFFRQQAAHAALSRTDWEIAFQEVSLAVEAVRAFDTLLYRQEKLRITEEFVRLNEESTRQVRRLFEQGTLRSADVALSRAEVIDVLSQVGQGRTAVAVARRDFYRTLGLYGQGVEPLGSLEREAPPGDPEGLLQAALAHRADLAAREKAVAEAEARLRLTVADRYGNPALGPSYEYNETRVNFIGLQFGVPLPVFNRRQGEVLQRQEELTRACLDLRQTEVEVRQEVPAAVNRLREAGAWVDTYRTRTLPELRKILAEMELLFRQGQPGVDVLRVLDIRRKLLRARDGYLDALHEYTQALADLAAAAGDPALAMGLYQAAEPLEPAHP
jgi:cobalt-zinc-cadmium efflux system outer membrane protein